jgi:hypothetical protein
VGQLALAAPVAAAAKVGLGQPLKAWKTLQAECLLAGFEASLIDGDDGRPQLVISRGAMTRSFTDLAAAQAWLWRAAGAQA